MYKQFVSSYEDADATLASPSGELVHQFQQMVEEVAESLRHFHQQAESDDAEIERLIDEVSSLASNVNRASTVHIFHSFTCIIRPTHLLTWLFPRVIAKLIGSCGKFP